MTTEILFLASSLAELGRERSWKQNFQHHPHQARFKDVLGGGGRCTGLYMQQKGSVVLGATLAKG